MSEMMSELITEKYSLAELRVVPTPTLTEGALPPTHSEVRKIAETVLGGLKLSFAAVAADPDVETLVGTVEHEMKAALATVPQERRRRYAEIASEPSTAAPRAREAVFGAAAEVDAATYLKAGGLGVLVDTVAAPRAGRQAVRSQDREHPRPARPAHHEARQPRGRR